MIKKQRSRASWIRTSDCSSQSAVPYRLAIALYMTPNVLPEWNVAIRVDKGIRTLGLQSHNLAR